MSPKYLKVAHATFQAQLVVGIKVHYKSKEINNFWSAPNLIHVEMIYNIAPCTT